MTILKRTLLTTLLCLSSVESQPVVGPLVFTDASAFVHQVTVQDGVDETRYRQAVSPLILSLPVAAGNIDIRSAYMYLEMRDSSGIRDARGPLDTQIAGEWDLGKALFTGYVNVPTGSDSLDTIAADLATGIARNDLGFPIKTFGHGLDFGGALTLAYQFRHWAFSVGGGYVIRGPYAPLENVSNYDPGDESTVTLGATYAVGGWSAGLDLAGTYIRVDREAGQITFRNGKQFVGRGSLAYTSRRLKIEASATEITRFKNLDASTGPLLYEDRDSNGNDFRARGSLRVTPISGWTIFGEATYKDLTKNAYDATDPLFQGAARLWSYGGGLTVQVGKREAMTVRVVRGDGWIRDRAQDVETLNIRVSVRVSF